MRSSSLATSGTLLPEVRTMRTASAWNSGVNSRSLRFGLDALGGLMDTSFIMTDSQG